jgi:hypothetical protein
MNEQKSLLPLIDARTKYETYVCKTLIMVLKGQVATNHTSGKQSIHVIYQC